MNVSESTLDAPALTFKPELADNISWTPDGEFLISQGQEGTEDGLIRSNISKWDAENGNLVDTLFDYRIETTYTFNYYTYYTYPVVAPDNTFEQAAFSLNSRNITLTRDTDVPRVIFVDNGTVKSVVWNRSNTQIAVAFGGDDTYQIQTFDVATGDLINTIWGPDYFVLNMTWNADNSKLAVTSVWANPFTPTVNVRVYTIAPGQDYFTDEDIRWGFDDIANAPTVWHPKRNLLAVSSMKAVSIYSMTAKEPVMILPVENISAIDWSPDGKYLAGGDQDGEVHIWNMKDLSE